MFYNNIRSVSANLAELEILIEERKPSIIALRETWFKNNDDVNLHCLEGYRKPFTNIGSEQRGGGVAMYVSECLQAELVHTDEDFESVSVKVAHIKKQNYCFLVLLSTFAKRKQLSKSH